MKRANLHGYLVLVGKMIDVNSYQMPSVSNEVFATRECFVDLGGNNTEESKLTLAVELSRW